MFNNLVFRITSVFCVLALLFLSMSHAICQDCRPIEYFTCEEECQKRDLTWLKDLAIFSSAATIGVIGGIVAANGNKKHCNHRGDSIHGTTGPAGVIGPPGEVGPPGWTGPAAPGFHYDDGQMLTVHLVGIFPTVPDGTLTAIPYVTLPNGDTIEGELETLAGGSHSFTTLEVTNPVLGMYCTGIQIFNTNNSVNGITLNGSTVTTTRGGIHTVNLLVPLAGNTILSGQSLISTTFIYDDQDIP